MSKSQAEFNGALYKAAVLRAHPNVTSRLSERYFFTAELSKWKDAEERPLYCVQIHTAVDGTKGETWRDFDPYARVVIIANTTVLTALRKLAVWSGTLSRLASVEGSQSKNLFPAGAVKSTLIIPEIFDEDRITSVTVGHIADVGVKLSVESIGNETSSNRTAAVEFTEDEFHNFIQALFQLGSGDVSV